MPECYHKHIDARLLRLTERAILRIDANPDLLLRMRENIARWSGGRLRAKWGVLLDLPWSQLRGRLLEKTEAGAALRQEAPLGGILTATERSRIMREFTHDARAA